MQAACQYAMARLLHSHASTMPVCQPMPCKHHANNTWHAYCMACKYHANNTWHASCMVQLSCHLLFKQVSCHVALRIETRMKMILNNWSEVRPAEKVQDSIGTPISLQYATNFYHRCGIQDKNFFVLSDLCTLLGHPGRYDIPP